MRRQTLLVVLVALLWNSLTLAQTSSATARKFDEFGDIQASDLIARLDNLAVTLSYARRHIRQFLQTLSL